MPSASPTSFLTLSMEEGAGYSVSWSMYGISLYSRYDTSALDPIRLSIYRATFLLKDSLRRDPTIITILFISFLLPRNIPHIGWRKCEEKMKKKVPIFRRSWIMTKPYQTQIPFPIKTSIISPSSSPPKRQDSNQDYQKVDSAYQNAFKSASTESLEVYSDYCLPSEIFNQVYHEVPVSNAH